MKLEKKVGKEDQAASWMGGHGTESLASCAAARAGTPAGLQQRPARQKLFAESVTTPHMPALVCSTSERTVELVRRGGRGATPGPGTASVAKAMAAPVSEFGFKTLLPTEAEFR